MTHTPKIAHLGDQSEDFRARTKQITEDTFMMHSLIEPLSFSRSQLTLMIEMIDAVDTANVEWNTLVDPTGDNDQDLEIAPVAIGATPEEREVRFFLIRTPGQEAEVLLPTHFNCPSSRVLAAAAANVHNETHYGAEDSDD